MFRDAYCIFSHSICVCSQAQGAVRQGTKSAANAMKSGLGDVIVPPNLRGAATLAGVFSGEGEDSTCKAEGGKCTWVWRDPLGDGGCCSGMVCTFWEEECPPLSSSMSRIKR